MPCLACCRQLWNRDLRHTRRLLKRWTMRLRHRSAHLLPGHTDGMWMLRSRLRWRPGHRALRLQGRDVLGHLRLGRNRRHRASRLRVCRNRRHRAPHLRLCPSVCCQSRSPRCHLRGRLEPGLRRLKRPGPSHGRIRLQLPGEDDGSMTRWQDPWDDRVDRPPSVESAVYFCGCMAPHVGPLG